MYVCICHAVTRDEFDTVVADGAHDVETVGERCGAGTGCGTCIERLGGLLRASAVPHLDRVPARA